MYAMYDIIVVKNILNIVFMFSKKQNRYINRWIHNTKQKPKQMYPRFYLCVDSRLAHTRTKN